MGILGRAGLSASFLVASSVMFAGNGAIAQSYDYRGQEKLERVYVTVVKEQLAGNPNRNANTDARIVLDGKVSCSYMEEGKTSAEATQARYDGQYSFLVGTERDRFEYVKWTTFYGIVAFCPKYKDWTN